MEGKVAEKVIITGGGTGGHLFPALALADEFRERGWEVLFVGSGKEWERKIISARSLPYMGLPAAPIKGRGGMELLRGIMTLGVASFKALGVLRSQSPSLVLGVGGYSSGAMILASALRGIPRVIQEQNVIPGLANRLAARFAQRVFCSFEETRNFFPEGKVSVTGNPIRREVLSSFERSSRGERFTLLVLGGSQGARAINEAMTDALPFFGEMKGIIRVIHQTGEMDRDWVEERYRREGVEATVLSFIEDIGKYYAKAHLVVSRAGASTVAELCALGRAAVLIPYPFAADDHQRRNAELLQRHGAAVLIDERVLGGELLAGEIKRLWLDRSSLQQMERRALALGRRDAASRVVEECLHLVEGR